MHSLADKLDSDSIMMDTPLEALWRQPDGSYGLRFGGLPGSVIADHVLLCLPFTLLRDVDLTDSGLSAKRMQSIERLGMGVCSKNHVQLQVRPYKLGKWSGVMSMNEPSQDSWDSTEVQPGQGSVITVYRGGRSATQYPTDVAYQRAPDAIVRETLAAFERGVPGITQAFNESSWLDIWVRDRWARGAYASFLPGQYTKYWGYLGKSEGGVHFAGEHTSTDNQGYLNGAVETGARAAREVLAAL